MKQGHGHTGPRNLGEGELKFQVRINLTESFAAAARANPADPALKPLQEVLAKYDASIKHQEMSFGNFLPYFENEERPELLKEIKRTYRALEEAQLKGVDAEIEALKAYEAANANFIERARLYLWTKDTMQKPETQKKYATRFTVYADGGKEVYDKAVADGLVSDLAPLQASGMITKIDKFDSDPAHNPQAPRKFHR